MKGVIFEVSMFNERGPLIGQNNGEPYEPLFIMVDNILPVHLCASSNWLNLCAVSLLTNDSWLYTCLVYIWQESVLQCQTPSSSTWKCVQTFLLRIKDRAQQCCKGARLHGGGDTAQKNLYWEGGQRTYFVEEGNNWGGDTAQHWLSLSAKFHACVTLLSDKFLWGLLLVNF